MPQHLALITLVVRDYDEAIAYYTRSLGFTLFEDTDMGGGKRWVRVCPPGAGEARGCELLLAKATTPEQMAAVGNQTGGRVAFFLHTDDFDRDYGAYLARGVTFIRQRSTEPYGTVAVFQDLYGNKWDLVQPSM
jgi:catechol 2,3-dioxygenase-like lactoylglutathione lyase family enzyme